MDFQKLFDVQIQKLEELDYSARALDQLREQRNEVLTRVRAMNIGLGNLPFLAVLPRQYLIMTDIMPRYYRDKDGKTLNIDLRLRDEMVARGEAELVIVNPNYVEDIAGAPDEPYFIYDVEDGSANLGQVLQTAKEEIERQNRSFLTVAEAWMLDMHTDVLIGKFIMALGSLYNLQHYPFLYKDPTSRTNPRPKLHHFTQLNFALSEGKKAGIPSCLR